MANGGRGGHYIGKDKYSPLRNRFERPPKPVAALSGPSDLIIHIYVYAI